MPEQQVAVRFEVKLNASVTTICGAGPATAVTGGATAGAKEAAAAGGVTTGGGGSTVNVRLAGVGSTLPAASVVRASNVYTPGAKPLATWTSPPEHGAKSPGVSAAGKTRQANATPGSLAASVHVKDGSVVTPPSAMSTT